MRDRSRTKMDLSINGRQGPVDRLTPIVSSSTEVDVSGGSNGSGSPNRTTTSRLENVVDAMTISDDDCVVVGDNSDHRVSNVYHRFIPCMGTSREFVSHTISAACKGIEKQNTDGTLDIDEIDSEHCPNRQQTQQTVEEENPGFVKECFDEMNKELVRQLGHPPYSWSNESIFYNQSYLDDRDFKLMFLRTELLCQQQEQGSQQQAKVIGKDAADRYVRFLEFKLDLFGWDKLTRAIVQADLDQEDIIALQSGVVEIVNANSPPATVARRRRSTGSVGKKPFKPELERHLQQHTAGDSCSAIVLVRPHLSEKIRSIENAVSVCFELMKLKPDNLLDGAVEVVTGFATVPSYRLAWLSLVPASCIILPFLHVLEDTY